MKEGENQKVKVSIQNTTELETLQGVGVDYVRGSGDYRTKFEAPVYRVLAADAERNALNPKEKNIFMQEPSAKEGKWTKTDSVPVSKVQAGASVLEKTSGYVTKVGNDNIYIQGGRGEYAINYKGLVVSNKRLTTLAQAKDYLDTAVKQINNNNGQAKNYADAVFTVLNNNQGRISRRVYKEINMQNIINRL